MIKLEKPKLDSLSSTPRFNLELSVGKSRKHNLLVVGFFITNGKKTSGYDSDLIIKKTAAVSLWLFETVLTMRHSSSVVKVSDIFQFILRNVCTHTHVHFDLYFQV